MSAIIINEDYTYSCRHCDIKFGNYPASRLHAKIHTTDATVVENERPPVYSREVVRDFILSVDGRWGEIRRALLDHGATHREIRQIEAEMVAMGKDPACVPGS